MRTNLWITILLLTAGSNTLVPEICAAHCMVPAGTASVHHHRHHMSTDAETPLARESVKYNAASGRQSADCAECASSPRHGQSLTGSCANLAQMEALKEGSFSLEEPQAAASGDLDLCSGQPGSLQVVTSQIFLDRPRTVRSSRTATISLRV